MNKLINNLTLLVDCLQKYFKNLKINYLALNSFDEYKKRDPKTKKIY